MSLKTKLDIGDGEEYDITDFECKMTQSSGPAGITGKPLYGTVHFTMQSPGDDNMEFHRWMADKGMVKDGRITFPVIREGKVSEKNVRFGKARCVGLREHFEKGAGMLMHITLLGSLKFGVPDAGYEEPAVTATGEDAEVKCSLYFRRPADYDGSFGFDWLRTGDTGEAGDHWYRDIMEDIPAYSALQQYDDLVATQYHSFTEGWKEGHPVYGGNSRYVVPWLTLMPGATARLRLKLDVEENPEEKIALRFGSPRDAQHLSLSFTEIPAEAGAYYHSRELEITCLKKFDNDITLHARAGDTEVGRLVIAGHRHMKKIQVAMITVKSLDKTSTPVSKTPDKQVEERLRRYLGQAYIVPDFFSLTLDLTVIPEPRERVAVYRRRKVLERVVDVPENLQGETKEILFHDQPLLNSYFWFKDKIKTSHPDGTKHWGSFHNFLNAMLGQQNPALREDLEKTFKLYFFNEKSTDATVGELKGLAIGDEEALRTRAAVVFAVAYDRDTPTHELLHCLGLDHTFVESGLPAEKYRFTQSWTDNMMDYEPRGGKTNRFCLWYWQIKKLWRYLENL